MSVVELTPDEAERLWSKVDVGHPLGCWEWTGSRSVGYGYFSFRGRWVGAHRVVHRVMKGPIPTGYDIDHLCRNRGCVNPDHIEPVTRKENLRRSPALSAVARIVQGAKTHCPQGHPYSGDNLYIYADGRRKCRTCSADSARRSAREKRKKSA